MSHFARVVDGIVTKIIVAEQDYINNYNDGEPGVWIQTSYNTDGGEHPEGRPLRKNYAGIGYAYDSVRDAFIAPKPFNSWVLNESTCKWEAPTAMPSDGQRYSWDETSTSWVLVE